MLVICRAAAGCPIAETCRHGTPHEPVSHVGVDWNGEEITYDACNISEEECGHAFPIPVICIEIS